FRLSHHAFRRNESHVRVCSKITSDFGGSAAWPDARREEGASPPVGCDRRATKQMARRRPAPEGWGCLAVWRCCSLLTDRWRVCSSLAPSQKAKQPPAKSEFIFEQTLKPGTRGHVCPRSHLEYALGKKSWHGT